MGSTAKRNAKQSARATAPAASRPRARTAIRAPGRSNAKTAKRAVAPARAAPTSTPAKTRPRPAPFPLRAVLEQLEPRLLMSADLLPLAADALFAAPTPAGGAEFRSLTDAGRSSAVTADGVAPIQRTHEVVFVDPRVPDRNQLLAGLAAQAADGRSFEVIVLDPACDGIAQVTAALADRIQIDAVHFLTHGANGAVQLGATWVDAKTVAANADAIKGWGNALKADADLLFYGCDLAATARGRALVDWLAELTKADVAASTDATGSARGGGDWELEAKSGSIETELAISADARANWSHALNATPSGSETRANATTGNTQDAAAMATAPDGRFVVAWVSDGQPPDGSGKGVFARLYDANGAPQTGEILVNTTTSNNQVQPAVAMDGFGNFVVVWSGNGVGDGNGVFARRFDATGNPIAALPEFRVNGAVGFNQSNPDVAMELNGDFAVVWQSDETGTIEIWMQRYQANGTALGGAALVSVAGVNADTDASIAMDDDGDLVVAWQGQDADNAGVFARRYDNAGLAQGGAALVNTTTSGNQERPDVAMDAVGNYVVVWDGAGAADGSGTGIYGRRFNAAGAALSGEFGVNATHSNDQDEAAVGMASDGRFVVTWDSKNQDGNNQGVYRQEYTAAGALDGAELLVNTTTNSDQTRSAVAMNDGGGYVAAWDGEGPGDSAGVFWQLFAAPAAGTITGTVYHDIDGDGNLAGAGTFAGAVVQLYRDLGAVGIDAADTLITTQFTDGTGTYTFTGVALGSYYVAVDSTTLTSGAAYNGIFDPTWIWAEQTYGAAGSALGAGFTAGSGVLYGGRERLGAGTSDDAANLQTAEHVARVTNSGTGAGGVDFGFSFNAVTTNRDGDDAAGNRTIQGSLRQFIQNANAIQNASFGIQSSNFSINYAGGGGPQSIGVLSALPAISDAVVLDAGTQEGFTSSPLIELNGSLAGPASGLTLGGTGGSTVRGFVINRFTPGNGILVNTSSNGNSILGNWIGTDATGAAAQGNNGNGIHLFSDGNVVNGNVISGNSGVGIEIGSSGSNNRIIANIIGLNAAGTTALTNNSAGVRVSGDANTIGGTSGGERNVISANIWGVEISGLQAIGNLVQGNYIGTDVTGTLDRGNLQDGVRIAGGARNNIVGGAGAGNVISGNTSDGVEISGSGTTGNVVRGNLIGTNAAGTGALGNTGIGVFITAGAAGNIVGGPAAADRNVISGNTSDGVRISGTNTNNNVVQGNYVGVDITGSAPLGNTQEGVRIDGGASANIIGGPGAGNTVAGNLAGGLRITGSGTNGNRAQGNWFGTNSTLAALGQRLGNVEIDNGASNNTVGGVNAGEGNVIAYADDDGVLVYNGSGSSQNNAILGNRIFGNDVEANGDGTGIDLAGPFDIPATWEVTPNDTGDPDTGPNALQNFPVLTGAATSAGTVTIAGRLNSTPGTNFRIEFFASATADASGHGEGERYLGSVNVTTDAAGEVLFTANLLAVVGVGEAVSATATRTDAGFATFFETSELAASVIATPPLTISGTVRHDVDGDADVVEAGTFTFGGATVHLFLDDGDGAIDAADVFQGTATTDAAGQYVFGGLAGGTYWVTVDSTTLTAGAGFNPGYDPSWIWAEQTYGDDSSTVPLDLGARYGGRSPGISDNAVAGSPVGAEHVSRVTLAGGNALGVDSGFSFNAVVNTADDAAGVPGNRTVQGSLRQFILNANALDNGVFGVQSSNFSIGPVGTPQTINVTATALRAITDALILDAWTQGLAGYSGAPLVELDGSAAGAGAHGLTITAGGSTVRGFVINDFQGRGISVAGGGGNTIAGNYIGTDTIGTADRGNALSGIFIDNSAGNLIGGAAAGQGNLISGNAFDGVSINGAGSFGNLIQGNHIGVNAAGTAAIANGEAGVNIDSGAWNNTVGGVAAAAGNVISGNLHSGVEIDDAGTTGNVVLGNYIGLNATGDAAIANVRSGVTVTGASGNTIGGTVAGAGNVISGNNWDGVALVSANGNLVQGNFVGTDWTGDFAVANREDGIYVLDGANNLIGGVGAGNLVSGNLMHGLEFRGAATDNVAQGNYVGVNAAGDTALANGISGVLLNGASGNTIGGTVAGSGNVLSGNLQDGITGFAASDNLIQGNFIGTDATGSFAIGNREDGIYLQDGSDNTVGGNSLAAGNLISGNLWTGITFWGTGGGNLARGNYIGTDALGTGPIGNAEAGVYIGTTGGATIGGTVAGEGNLIAYNGWDGVALMAGTGHSVLGNSIHSNAEQAIDILDDGITPNDPGDGDAGPNGRQNYPVLFGAAVNGPNVAISGSLNSAPGGTYLVEFYANAVPTPGGDASLHGEGERYLGAITVTTDASGNAAFSASLAASVAAGEIVSATATDLATGSTSELALNVAATAARSISGMTRHDLNANGIADDGGAFFDGAQVNLYLDDGDGAIDAGDAFVASTFAAGGTYIFGGLAEGTYYVAVDSRTLHPSQSIWAEQTYGVAGAARGGAFLGAAGNLYGGRSATVSDDFSSLVTSEHVTRVVLAGANATGVDSGFSFVAITSSRDGDDDLGNASRSVQGSLRQFIQNANTIGGPQVANFSIGGGGFQSIALASALPVITDTVTLDATTQELFGTTPLIELNGSGVATLNDGFQISASGVTVRGFIINGFLGDGIHLDGSNSVIAGNWIGLDATGTVALGNGSPGVHVLGANNVIGGTGPNDRNVISGNAAEGIRIDSAGATGNLVQGNFIGTDLTGTLDRGNADGIRIQNGANGNTIGGTAAAEGNVISGNEDGIEIRDAGTSLNVVLGNYIGTTAGGAGALGNSESGIEVTAANNTIGGTVPGAGNTIAFNAQDGVMVTNASTTGVLILGNVIHSNAGIAIDLADDGPTANDAGDGDTGANNLQNFPVLTGAATTGTTVTIAGSLDSTASTNYRIEFFASGVGGPRFLGAGSPTLFVGAAGSATFSYTLTASVAVGETITATATNLATSSTSELSAAVTAAPAAAISGTLFHDVNGNANVTDDAGAVFANVAGAVALYLDDGDGVIDSGDSFVSSVNTNASGQYTFSAVASGTYYVAVNSKALAADPVWAEQTYAVAGAANNTAGTSFTVATGALYGGRSASASDNALGSLTTAEHVTKVALVAGNVNDINSGFSFNAITSSRDGDDDAGSGRTVQGSLRQFIQNANVLTGTQTANFSIGGGGPQTINVTGSALPTITGPVVLDAAATQEGFTGTPIIELTGTFANGLSITGGGSTVRGFAINRFQTGIALTGAGGNTIAGNYLGTNLGGTADGGGSAEYGIRITSNNNVIGGLTAADRNVISGNNIDGIWVSGASGNLIQGNYIGTDATGTFAIPNAEDGIWLEGGSGNTVGGTAAGARNVLAGNGWSGVGLSGGGSNHVIQGNWIGLSVSGAALGNLRNGVQISDGTGTQVGGTAVGAGNVIANNGTSGPGWAGVAIGSGNSHSVLGNLIYSNSGLGIDVDGGVEDAFGVTANDAGDGDAGTNGLQNFPVLTGAATASGQITIAGVLNSTPGGMFRIEFFASPSSGDASGYGEGERYLGSTTVTTDAGGNANFLSPAFTATVLPGERISATATNLAALNTSEFSAHIAATGPNPVLDLDANDSSGAAGSDYQTTFTENGPAVTIADALDALLTDPDSPTLTGVTVAITNLADGAAETLSAAVGGTSIVANYAGGVLQLTGADTIANYQQVLRTVAYHNASDFPSTAPRVITLVATDGANVSNTATATVSVVAANDPPAGANNAVATNEDTAYTFLAGHFGFSDPDVGDSLTAVRIDTLLLPAGATLLFGAAPVVPGTVFAVAAINAGNLVFTPALNGNGAAYASFTFSVRDQALAFDPAPRTMTINVLAVNDAPVANDDTAVVGEDSGATTIDVLANDSFAPDAGEALTIIGVTQGAGGSVAIVGGTTVTYTPNADFFGPDSFTYTISDGNGGTAAATVSVTVTPANDPPQAVNDVASVAEDSGTNTINVLANDSIAPDAGETLTITGVTQGASGSVAIVGGTTVTYTPNTGYSGPDSFTYTIDDGNGGTATATVTVTVSTVNDPPTANNDVATVAEDSGVNPIDVLLNDSILPDAGETLSIIAVSNGASGTVAITGGGSGLTYTPNADFFGPDSFTYTISDGNGGTATATVNVTVTPANDPPQAVNDPATVAEDSGAGTINVLANDSITPDVGETLTITGVTQGANGTVSIVGGTTVTYTPNADFFGPDSFTYTISDGNGGSDTAAVNVTVTPANDPPQALNDLASVAEDSGATTINVLANDSFAPDAGETLTITGVTQGASGSVAIVGGTTVTYTPNVNFFGPDSFTYTISDGNGGTATATVNVTVTPANDTPVANDDAATVAEDSVATTINVLANDSFAPDVGETLTIVSAVPGANGVVAIVGGTTVTYTPNTGFFGPDSFTYTIEDGNGGTATATVNVTVTPANDPPVANDDVASVAEDSGASTIDVLLNDSIAPDLGEILTITGITQGANGTVAILGGGASVSYTPNADFFGPDSFTYTVDDGNGGTATATVNVTVAPANDPPVANDDVATVAEDSGANTLDVLLNDSIVPDSAETLSITGVTQGASGSVAIVGGTTVTYTPNAGYSGPDSFTYTIDDGNGGTTTATVTVTVTNVNNSAPLNIVPGAQISAEDTPLVFSTGTGNRIAVSDPDADPNPLEVTLTAVQGALTLAGTTGLAFTVGDGTADVTMTFTGAIADINAALDGMSFLPTLNYDGPASVTITTNDLGSTGAGGPQSDTDTVNIAVVVVDDSPTLDLDFNNSSGALGADYVRTFTEGFGSVPIADIDARLLDNDSANLASLTVTITNLLDGVDEVLTADTTGTLITANFIPGSGVLTLNGADTVANYQQVLRTVRYENLSDAPDATQRLITFVASDGGSASNVGTARVTIVAVNDAPTAAITAPSYAATENVPLALHATGLGVADIDALPASVVTVYLSSISGLLSATASNGTGIAGDDSPTLTLTGTLAQINGVLDGTAGTVTYLVGSDSPAPTDTLDLAIDDMGATGSGGAQWGWDSVTVNLTAVNDAPLITTPGAVSTPEDTPLVFSAGGGNQISITDVDAAGSPVELSINATNGVVTLAGTASLVFFAGDGTADASMTFRGTVAAINAALDGLVFAPPANYNGSGFLSLIVNDLGNSGLGGPLSDGPDLVTITITPVNDLPSGADNAVSMPQDTTRVFSAADFSFSDIDAGDAMSAVRIDTLSLPPGATLQLGGANVTPGQVIAAAQLGTLVFTPGPGMAGPGYASFTFSVQDTSGPAFDASPNTFTLNVTPVGTPGITVTPIAGLVTTEAGGNATFSVVLDTQPLADVVITLSSSDATEGMVAPVSLTFTSADWNVAQTVTVTGVADALADGGVLYTIVLDPAASADLGYAGLDPADVSVTNLEANAPPTVTVPPGYAITEGSFLALVGTGLSVVDTDAGAANVTVTLSVSAGMLVVSGLPTVTVAGSGTPVVTLTGPVADIDALLAGGGMVNYFVGSDAPPAFDTLTLAINDNHPFDPRTASASVAIGINPVNDAPVNTLPGGSTTLEDNAVLFSAAGGNQVSVTDVDAGGAPLQVTLNGTHGVITLSGTGGLAFSSGDGTADASLTFTGTLPAINAALNGLVFTPNLDYNGLAFIQLSTNDLGASGAGGALSDTDLATIDVLAVNDAPNGTDTPVTLNEDSTYTFNAGNFGFTDVDFGDAMTEVRIDSVSLPAGATLMLGATPVTAGTVIPVANIGTLVFTPVADANGAGYASFTFSVRDTGVPPGPLFDLAPNTMTVNVTPVNDLPIITSDGGGATAAFVVVENTTAVTTATATDIDLQPLTFSLAGVDAAQFSIDSVTGVLTFNAAPNFEAPTDAGANNVYNVTVRVSDGAGGVDTQALTITVADANDAPVAADNAYVTDEDLTLAVAATGVLGNDGDEDGTPVTAVLVTGPANGAVAFNADGSFVYTPNVNFFGVDTFTYQASDGALGSALATVTVTVNPINDAPTAADGNVTIAAAYAFSVADFNYFDVDGDPLDRLRITALPVEGQLLFDGLAVTLNQEVTAGEVAAGRLTYVPPTTSSAIAASFGFSVSDGTLYEAASHTMTIGFASGAVIPPAPPPAPPTITPPATPPADPPAEPPAASEPTEPGGGASSGGGRGGGSGGGEGAAPPAPPAPEGAAAPAESAQAAAAGVVASAAPQAGSAPAGSIGFQSGGVAANPNIAAPALPADQRGEPPAGEVKAEMEVVAAMAAPEVRQALDEMRERAQEDTKLEARVSGSVFVVSTGLSVGYVLWLLRGGALIASLLSSLPAWRLVDPLPVLGSMGGRAGDEDDDSLEDLVANNDPPSVPGEDALADNDNVGSVRT